MCLYKSTFFDLQTISLFQKFLNPYPLFLPANFHSTALHSKTGLAPGFFQVIARAVVANPKLILADEPTGNLDSKNGKEVMGLLSELNKEGTTIVMVTHSQHDAGFADRVINLFDGQVVTEVTI